MPRGLRRALRPGARPPLRPFRLRDRRGLPALALQKPAELRRVRSRAFRAPREIPAGPAPPSLPRRAQGALRGQSPGHGRGPRGRGPPGPGRRAPGDRGALAGLPLLRQRGGQILLPLGRRVLGRAPGPDPRAPGLRARSREGLPGPRPLRGPRGGHEAGRLLAQAEVISLPLSLGAGESRRFLLRGSSPGGDRPSQSSIKLIKPNSSSSYIMRRGDFPFLQTFQTPEISPPSSKSRLSPFLPGLPRFPKNSPPPSPHPPLLSLPRPFSGSGSHPPYSWKAGFFSKNSRALLSLGAGFFPMIATPILERSLQSPAWAAGLSLPREAGFLWARSGLILHRKAGCLLFRKRAFFGRANAGLSFPWRAGSF